MPNIWTHILFCEEVLEGLENSAQFTNEWKNYLNLGAQGPDPFFYHNFLPWKKDTRVNLVGEYLHKEQCGPFLMDLIKDGMKLSTNSKAYILGFVTHHILDRNTHPYIHYHAGYENNNHQRLEVIIDTIMMKESRNVNTWKVPVYKEINIGPRLDEEINSLLEKSIEKYYGNKLTNLPEQYIQASYSQMKSALRILFDPYKWKNTLFATLVSAFSHQPLKDEKDYLNEEKRTWRHPATNEPQNDTFLSLYEQAKKEGIEVIQAVLSYWKNPNEANEKHLKTLIDNISYDTGKPVSENLEVRYAEPIV